MEEIIASFATEVGAGNIEIYNEFSLQHELGIYLRNAFSDKKIQFERNVSFFGLNKMDFVKREIDISIFESMKSRPEAAIELKYPKNGQYPEQMFSFCKDVSFIEQLKRSGFRNTYVIIFAEDHLFYEGSQNGIYGFFRGGKNLSGFVQKPTGNRDSEINIEGCYTVRWQPVKGSLKYSVIKAQ